ncbi:hypothetical protein [Corynebacterium lizhenjunii]|uniref:hypothetical protein n=1 Tax=Corynebacterium lizhenjunii TaxID=2709394 RepID=UPI0013EBE4E2|nr:hypothetical protein [Corynebacterium lizhenjunii]
MRVQSLITAFALVATGCFALAGCARPSPPGPEPVPVVEQASEAKSADATAAGFAMPAPGPFDPNAPGYWPFKPCEDIPDEILAKIGIIKGMEGGDSYEPYLCFVDSGAVKGKGTLAFAAYPNSLKQLIEETGLELSDEPGPGFEDSAVLTAPEFYKDGYCVSGVETPVGFIAVKYISWVLLPSGTSLCEVPTRIIQQLYGGEK